MLENRNTERHEMILQETHEGGAEEWYCPICGRRFLMQWPPNFKRIVLECGDENAIHTGSKGGVPTDVQVQDKSDGRKFDDAWETELDEFDLGREDLAYDYDDEALVSYDADLYREFDYYSFYADQEESGLSVELMAALEALDFTVLDRFDEE